MKPVLYRYWQAAIKRWGYTENPTMGQPLFTEPGVKYEPLYPPQMCMCGLWPHSPGCPTPAAPAQQDSEPTQEQLDAFILRAGFRWGWENVEGAARMMARQAVTELNALAAPQSPSVQHAAEELLTEIRTALNASGVWHLGMDTVDVIKSLIASRAVQQAAATEPKALRDAARAALNAYEARFDSIRREGNYIGPIDDEMKALRAALAADQKGENDVAV